MVDVSTYSIAFDDCMMFGSATFYIICPLLHDANHPWCGKRIQYAKVINMVCGVVSIRDVSQDYNNHDVKVNWITARSSFSDPRAQ